MLTKPHKHQKQPGEFWSSLLPYRKSARGKKGAALRQHLFVCSVCSAGVRDPSQLSLVLEEQWESEINDFSDTSHMQAGSESLTSLSTAVALSLGAITSLLMSQGSLVASALQHQPVPSWAALLPLTSLSISIDIYFFPHTSKGKRERNVNN